MMIISIDPVQRRIGILSIPRDTYVDVPNYGLSRVNAACTIGNVRDPGSGPRLAMQTVQYNFGIRINDYLMVDFDTFISFIDRIGGIDVMVERTIDDPTYPNMNYGYDPFYLEAGQQHLDGETALKYARSRHDSPEGDIDRAERQQQILFAVRDKVLNVNMLDDLLVQSPVLWEEFESGISTGLTLEQIVRLAVYAKDIPSDKIIKGVVTYEYLIGYRTESGGSVLIPNRNKLISLMLEVFGEGYDE
jgi:LCP family protein required for cell wall assembly